MLRGNGDRMVLFAPVAHPVCVRLLTVSRYGTSFEVLLTDGNDGVVADWAFMGVIGRYQAMVLTNLVGVLLANNI